MPLTVCNVLVLGESNSVMRGGWTYGLAKGLSVFAALENRSIGSTSILNAIFQIFSGNALPQNYDTVILDSMINDSAFFRYDLGEHTRLFESLLKFLKQLGTNIVVMNFERSDKDYISPLRASVENICAKYGAVFFDTRSRIQKIADERGQKFHELYHNSAHQRPEVAFLLGLEVADIIKMLPRATDSKILPTTNFSVLDHRHVPYANKFYMQNRLIALPGIVVDEGGLEIEVPTPLRGSEIVGIIYNAGATTGCLQIGANQTFVKRLTDSRLSTGNLLIWGRRIKTRVILGERVSLKSVRSHNVVG